MSYRADIKAAVRKLDAQPRAHLAGTPYGTIEYAVRGEGPALLVSHPLLGGFDIGLTIADLYVGPGFRVIAPSRFGYLGSSLPAHATVEDQADAYALLLDELGVDRAAVFAYSAGGPSALQFALRHPDRTAVLGLLAPPLPGKTGRPPKPIGNVMFGSDLFFWTLKAFLPATLTRILGMPKHFHPTADERVVLTDREAELFPIRPRKRGALFDVYVSTPSVQSFPLAEIAVPTLLLNASDDGLSAFSNAVAAAEAIPRVTFTPFEEGGHLLLGQEAAVRGRTAPFLGVATPQ